MAIMFPSKPNFIHKSSLEDKIFDSLQKLNDEYYVFHSYKLWEHDEITKDVEIDFIIFHPSKGVISLEAKAGDVQVINNEWHYANGKLMSNGGPFNQARQNKYAIRDMVFKKSNKFDLIKKIPFMHAVCFPSITRGALYNFTLPADSPIELIITINDLENIEISLDKIINFHHIKMQQKLLEEEIKYFIYNILSPSFKIIVPPNLYLDLKQQHFLQMLNEQYILMDFLDQQNKATISGSAGTGKTLLAVEKARRLSESNEMVLFLCYNRSLRDNLENKYKNSLIDFLTIDMLAYKFGNKNYNHYKGLKNYLEDCFLEELNFEYMHVIIDEGQDFGQEAIEDYEIIELLDLIIEKKSGTFYVFYDKNQLIQGEKIPKYISDSDCKINLTKNCRNTFNIASTSMKPINKVPIVYKGSIEGEIPKLYLFDNIEDKLSKLEELIAKFEKKGYKDIVVLSVKSSHKSSLNIYPENVTISLKNANFRWTTTRKFKGLESDVVILFDVDKDTFTNEKLLFYVGSSRARLELAIFALMSHEEAKLLVSDINPAMKKYKAEKGLAAIIGAVSEN